jgi:gliding motility-associated-like protein
MLFFSAGPLLAQTTCSEEEPFLLPPTNTFCADSAGYVDIDFKIFNNGEPGTYRVDFPDGTDTLYTNVVNTVTVERRFLFDCAQPLGTPLPPSADARFYEYQGALIVTREDCVDERGDNQRGTYDFRVVPNPIVDIKTSDLICIEEPFIINFTSVLCSQELVESFQWYMNGELLEGQTGPTLNNIEFPGPGTHVVGLEVTSFKGCEKYVYEKPFTIRPTPTIDLSYILDTAQLCDPEIIVQTNTQYEFATEFNWSSPSEGVTFSDPTAPNPDIFIDNNQAGVRTIIINASNQWCSAVADTFYITTQRGQTIEVLEDIVTCTGYILDLCASLQYLPTPENIIWRADREGVFISDSTSKCPKLSFDQPGNFVLTATGSDVCGEIFDIPVNIRVRDGSALLIDISEVDTLCTVDPTVNLLDYVSKPENVLDIRGPGVADNVFDPSVVSGDAEVLVTDSCGAQYPLLFHVIPQEFYEGINPTICMGESVDLYALQAGRYSGTGVTDNVFSTEGLNVGTYRIAFSSLSVCGGEDTLTIQVQEYPTATFEIVTETCEAGGADAGAIYAGLEPIFVENRSTARTLCYEIMETGQRACNQEKARFVMRNPGRYTLRQIVAFPEGACSDTTFQEFEVLFPPELDFSFAMDSRACDSLTIDFSLGNQPEEHTYDWSWSTLEQSTEAEPRIELLRPISAEVLAVNAAVTNVCYTTADTFGVVLPLRFRVSYDVLNDNNTVCSDDTIFLQNTSVNADNFRVTFPDGRETNRLPETLVLRNTEEDVMKYPIILEGSNISCPDMTAVDTIYVLPILTEAAFGLDYEDICAQAEINLTNASTPGALSFVNWGDGSSPQLVGELGTITHTYDTDRDTVYRIDIASRLCGLDSFSTDVRIRPAPDASFEAITTGDNCIGSEMIFVSTATENLPYGIHWDLGDGTFSQDFEARNIYEEPGEYRVFSEAVSLNGCTATDSLDITVETYDGDPVDFSAPSTICSNTDYPLDLRAPLTGWEIDYGNGIVSDEPVARPYFELGDYVLSMRATSANGCSLDTAMLVTVYPGFTAEIQTATRDTFVELGDPVALSVNVFPPRNIQEISWVGDSILNPNSAYTDAYPLEDGMYSIDLMDEHGCAAEDSLRVRVDKGYRSKLYIPNAFSPNGDGFNETFGIDVKPGAVERIRSLRIMNRFGAMVYECTDCPTGSVGVGWDGTLNGKRLPSSVYVWTVDIEFIDGSNQLYSGDLTLIR